MKTGTISAVGMIAMGAMLVSGCTTTQQSTGAGAVVGGGLGAMMGHNLGSGSGDRDKGALIGAGLGALMGNQMGKQKETQQQMDARVRAMEAESQKQTAWITNPNGSRTPVVLTRASGGMWVGPRGEYYSSFPTEAELKPLYGL